MVLTPVEALEGTVRVIGPDTRLTSEGRRGRMTWSNWVEMAAAATSTASVLVFVNVLLLLRPVQIVGALT